MIKKHINYWFGFALLISVISFLFYKSIFTDQPLNKVINTIEEVQSLHVQLHRDLLRFRSNQIYHYDTLNKTLLSLDEKINSLSESHINEENIDTRSINFLDDLIKRDSILVEDFKTHHSILQNSLFYIYRLSADLYSAKLELASSQDNQITAELITLLLEYKETPNSNIAKKIFPLIDKLNVNPDTDTKALINHSLIIIERLPEIDKILANFNLLDVEYQIALLKDNTKKLRNNQNNNAQIFNILLFLCTLYLIFYLLYLFSSLRKNEEALSKSNDSLNKEISLRKKTEKALYQLVDIDKHSNNDNTTNKVLYLLNALCKALDVEYAYISQVSPCGYNAKVLGLLDHGMFSSNFSYQLLHTPCEEVIKNGRLLHNSDLSNYFQNHGEKLLNGAVSYIGLRLEDNKGKVLGIIAVASKLPISDTTLAENILTIATSRAVIELEHQIEINNKKRYQQGLVLIDEWIARLITEGYDKEVFFKNVCRAAQEINNAQLAAFPVINKDKKSYRFLSASGLDCENIQHLALDVDDGGACIRTIINNKTQLIKEVKSDSGEYISLPNYKQIKSALITPVTLNDAPYGAIAVFKTQDYFDSIDERLLTQFSQSVQMAIINMRLVNVIRTERERAEITLHSIADAVITTNTQGEIEYMNHVAETLTAWPLSDAKNKAVQEIFRIEDMDTGEAIHNVVKSCLIDGISINKSILSLVSKNGNKKDIESSISPILNTSGSAEGVVIVFHDETQRRHLENTVKHQATHDPLTDLLNRNAFNIELSNHVYDAINNDNTHALCYMDLDRFKILNDTAGHSAGDQCLIKVTQLMRSCIRGEDVLCRIGGDEFGLILKNCTLESALKITNKIVDVISSTGFNWDDCNYKLGISIGLNLLNKHSEDTAETIRRADLACYTAKEHGRSQVYVYEEQDSELIRRQEESYWATKIHDAIENNRVCLYAQPIVSLKNVNQLNNHVEILVRLLDEDNQLVTPDIFIPAAERYKLMHLLDRKIIYETFSFISKYSDHDEDNTHFSINLSCDTLSDMTIANDIKGMADKFDIDTKTICFDIMETAAIKNLQQTRKLIKDLKTNGFRFALDNFGSGMSAFQYLKNLPIDYLKIDGSFVANMVNNNINQAMVAAINEIGHNMGIKTIAEYVENDQIVKKLKKLHVDFAQGYGIRQPEPLEKILTFYKDENSPSLKIIHNET